MTTELPPATPETMATLAHLLADRGVGLRVTDGGELQLRDPHRPLTDDDRQTVRHYRVPLAKWLEREPTDDSLDAPHTAAWRDRGASHVETAPETDAPGLPLATPCDRCGNPTGRDTPIHAGQSTRRDCARCGRTLGFPVWHGEIFALPSESGWCGSD